MEGYTTQECIGSQGAGITRSQLAVMGKYNRGFKRLCKVAQRGEADGVRRSLNSPCLCVTWLAGLLWLTGIKVLVWPCGRWRGQRWGWARQPATGQIISGIPHMHYVSLLVYIHALSIYMWACIDWLRFSVGSILVTRIHRNTHKQWEEWETGQTQHSVLRTDLR